VLLFAASRPPFWGLVDRATDRVRRAQSVLPAIRRDLAASFDCRFSGSLHSPVLARRVPQLKGSSWAPACVCRCFLRRLVEAGAGRFASGRGRLGRGVLAAVTGASDQDVLPARGKRYRGAACRLGSAASSRAMLWAAESGPAARIEAAVSQSHGPGEGIVL
jgi:hypothetical protein